MTKRILIALATAAGLAAVAAAPAIANAAATVASRQDMRATVNQAKADGIIGETAGEERLNTTGSSDSLDAALETLTPAQQDILHRFTYWDSKLYALCAAFLAARYG